VVVGTALIDALKSSLDKDNRATAGSIEAVTSLVRELAAGVRAARKG
jgi:tryptophan synthase alpha chain